MFRIYQMSISSKKQMCLNLRRKFTRNVPLRLRYQLVQRLIKQSLQLVKFGQINHDVSETEVCGSSNYNVTGSHFSLRIFNCGVHLVRPPVVLLFGQKNLAVRVKAG